MSSSSSSLASYSRPCPMNGYYDVFISFRGKDTRYGFTNNLYRSLRENKVYTFMDVKLVGEVIDSLFEKIRRSKIGVVVYSETFASSDWCLRELEMIVQLKKEEKMLMIPIFYKVDVHELKHLSGKTGEYLDKHIQEHGQTSVQKWKDAVITLGNVSGLPYKDRYELDFIMEVINTVKEKLEEWDKTLEIKPNSKDVPTRDNVMECHTVEITITWQASYMEGLRWVTSVDVHPTKPWVLLILSTGSVCIWNYETRAIKKLLKISFWSLKSGIFIPKKHWIVVGGAYGFVHVLDCKTLVKLKDFKAHELCIECVVVHPTMPYVLTASEDKLIKLWNWEDDWACCGTFEGHSHNVKQLAFSPRDSSSFASVSMDGTIKIWSLDSRVAKFTINESVKASNCVEYFVGNNAKLYLLSDNYDDYSIRIWDYEYKTLVQTLEGHTEHIWTTLVHPELPIILTGSADKTVRIWNTNTHQLLLVWESNHGEVLSFGFIKASKEVVIGCAYGMVVIKIAEVGTRSP